MPKTIIVLDEVITDLKELKGLYEKIEKGENREKIVRELCKRIDTDELYDFLISWRKQGIVEEMKVKGEKINQIIYLGERLLGRQIKIELTGEVSEVKLAGTERMMEEIMEMGGGVELKPEVYRFGRGNVYVERDVEVIGDGKGRTKIEVDKDIEMNSKGKGRIVLKNCTIKAVGGVDRVIRFVGGEVMLQGINFIGVKVEIDGGCKATVEENIFEKVELAIEVKDIDSDLIDSGNKYEKVHKEIEIKSCMGARSPLIKVKKDEVLDMEWVIDSKTEIVGDKKSKIKIAGNGCIVIMADGTVLRDLEIESEGDKHIIVVKGNNVKVEGCRIKGGVKFENGRGEIERSWIYHTKISEQAGALLIKNSRVFINECKMSSNYYNGISILDSSEAYIKNSELFENGNKEGSYSQIWIDNSVCKIDRSKIHDGINCNGIYSKSGKVKIEGSEIYKNYYNGIDVKEKSELEIVNSDIYENGNKEGYYPQIWIYNSVCKIDSSKIHDGINGTVIYKTSGEIKIEGSEEYKKYINEITREYSSGCFITTATLTNTGRMDDNCYELNLFRWFRDNYLLKKEYGRDLVNMYYRIAPLIVKEIDSRKDRDAIYEHIWKKYLKLCKNMIEEREFNKAERIYISMVKKLCMDFLGGLSFYEHRQQSRCNKDTDMYHL